MGFDTENCNVLGHAQAAGALDAADNHHRGDNSTNDTSGNIGIPGRGDLVIAATSQSAFDTAAAAIHGSWYTSKPADYKTASFRWHEALRNYLTSHGL